jgi:hypothetical protein
MPCEPTHSGMDALERRSTVEGEPPPIPGACCNGRAAAPLTALPAKAGLAKLRVLASPTGRSGRSPKTAEPPESHPAGAKAPEEG